MPALRKFMIRVVLKLYGCSTRRRWRVYAQSRDGPDTSLSVFTDEEFIAWVAENRTRADREHYEIRLH